MSFQNVTSATKKREKFFYPMLFIVYLPETANLKLVRSPNTKINLTLEPNILTFLLTAVADVTFSCCGRDKIVVDVTYQWKAHAGCG